MIYLGINNSIIRWKQSIIAAVQTAVIMLVLIITISTYYKQSEYYRPFANIINDKGTVYHGGYDKFTVTEDGTYNMSEFKNSLTDVDRIYFNLCASLEYEGNKTQMFSAFGLDDFLISYEPELEEGEWLQHSKKNDYVNIVVTENSLGIKTGDVVDLVQYHDDGLNYAPCYVCGVIKNGASIYRGDMVIPGTTEDFFYVFDARTSDAAAKQPCIFMKKEDMERSFNAAIVEDTMYIKYKSSISEESIINNNEYLISRGMTYDFSELNKNSVNSVKKKLMTIIPIMLGVFLFVSIGLATSSTISTVDEMNKYAVFFTTGMTWRGIVFLKMAESTVILGLGGVMFSIMTNIVNITKLHSLFEYKFYSVEILAIFLLFIYLIFIQTLIPYLFIRKKKCCDILRKAKI